MKPEEQNRAICEWLGRQYHKPTEQEIASGSYYQYEPNYVGNLNAMQEAVAKLDVGRDRFVWWMEHMLKIGHLKDGCEHRFPEYLKLIQSTAAQRAEALLRTIGKWTDDNQPHQKGEP